MKRKTQTLSAIALCFALCFSLSGCGSSDNPPQNGSDNVSEINQQDKAAANEAYYEWKDNLITELTSEGKEQTTLVIPARCEGFWGGLIGGKFEAVAFEDDDDVDLDTAFNGVDTLRSVDLPANLTVIPFRCFASCKSLEEINIPASVNELEDDAFSSCDALENIDLSKTGIKKLSAGTFQYCGLLSEVKLPEGLETICSYAFTKCNALASVSIPGSVKVIEGSAFLNSGITDVYFDEGITGIIIDKTAFGNDCLSITAHVKAGSWMDQNREAWDIPFKEIVAE